MKVSMPIYFFLAALVCHAEGALVSDEAIVAAEDSEPSPDKELKNTMKDISDAACRATQMASKAGIILGGGCGDGGPASPCSEIAGQLQAMAIRAEKSLNAPPCAVPAEVDEIPPIPTSPPPPAPCPEQSPPPSSLAQKAKKSGEKAKALAAQWKEAESDAKKEAALAKLKRKKAEMMKDVIARAYAKAAAEAKQRAASKVGVAAAVASAAQPPCKVAGGGFAAEMAKIQEKARKAELEEADAVSKQAQAMQAAEAASASRAKAACDAKSATDASQALADEANKMMADTQLTPCSPCTQT